FENTEVNVAIGSDRWSRGAGVKNECVLIGRRILQTHSVHDSKGSAIERNQISISGVCIGGCNIERIAVVRKGWRATHRDVGHGGISTDRRGGNPGPGAIGGDARQSALQTDGRGPENQKSEVDVAARVSGERSIDLNILLIDGGVG